MLRIRPSVAVIAGTAVILAGVICATPAAADALTVPGSPALTHVLAAGDTGAGDELFRWNPVLGATGYTVQVSTSPDFAAGADVTVVKTLLPSWVPSAPLGGQTDRDLWWRVAALSGSTTGGWSDGLSFTEPALAAPNPLGPGSSDADAQVRYPTPVSFSWDPVPGATSYVVQYAPVEDTDFSTTATVTSAATTAATYSPAAPLARTGGAWHWRVRASFAGTSTTGPWSTQERDFTVTWPSAVSKPVLLEPADSDGSDATDAVVSDPLFRWTAAAGAGSYRIAIGKSLSDDGTTVGDVQFSATVPTTSYVLTDPLLDAQYYWQVTPLDAAGQAGTSSDVQEFIKRWGAQTGPATTNEYATAYPVPLVGTPDLANPQPLPLDRFELSWEPLARTTYYEVEAAATDGSSTLTCQTASTSVTIFAQYASGAESGGSLRQNGASCLWNSTAAKRIQVGKAYRWRVRGVQVTATSTAAITGTITTNAIRSAWSDPRSDDHPDRATYVAPVDTTSTDAAALTTVQGALGEPAPLLTWQPITGATYYVVQIGNNSDIDNNVVATFRVPGTSLRANGVFADNQVSQPYYWRISAATGSITDSTVTYLGNWTTTGSWSKASAQSSFVGVTPVTQSDGTTLLRWAPQAVSAPDDGGSRGYLLTLTSTNSSGTVTTQTKKLTYPFFLAADLSTGKTLSPGTYTFTVKPLDATDTAGRASAEQTFTIDGSAPTGLAMDRSGSAATLSWAASPGAKSYKVVVSGAASKTLTTSQTAVQLTDLAPGVYSWSVTPTDSLGVVGGTSSSSFTVATGTVTTRTPASGAGTSTVVSRLDPALDWAPFPGASRYVVKITNASGSAVETAETLATSYVPTKALSYGTQYYWQVTAVPELSTTSSTRPVLASSASVPFTFNGAPGTPGTPRLTLTNGTTVTASWSALTGSAIGSAAAPAYVVRYGVVNAGTGVPDTWLPESTPSDTLSYAVNGLQRGVKYAFQVRAQNSLGTSAWSTQSTVTTGTVPGVPGNLKATAAGVGGLKVTWSSPSISTGSPAVSGYVVTYAIGSATAKQVTTTTTNVTLTGLTGRSSYTVKVAAKNVLGTGSAATVTAVPYAAPSAPASAKVTRGDRAATVTWAKPSSDGGSAITGYDVQLSTYSSSTKKWSAWTTKVSTNATTYKATLSSLVNGTAYHVRVYAKTAAAPTGTVSSTLSVTPAGKPAAPTSVKVAVSKGKAKVTWKKPSTNGSAITGYVLQYSTNGKTWKTKTSPKATATSYTWSKPTKKKTYYVRIYAKNAVGSGTVSAKVKFVAK